QEPACRSRNCRYDPHLSPTKVVDRSARKLSYNRSAIPIRSLSWQEERRPICQPVSSEPEIPPQWVWPRLFHTVNRHKGSYSRSTQPRRCWQNRPHSVMRRSVFFRASARVWGGSMVLCGQSTTKRACSIVLKPGTLLRSSSQSST